jgi:hypothetical protein
LWLAGVATVAVSIAVAAILYQFGFYVAAIIVAVLCALTLLPVAFLLGPADEDPDGARGGWFFGIALCGALIAVAASVVGQEEIVLVGTSARNVVAADAPHAAFLHFRNARVLTNRVDRVAVWAGTRNTHHVSFYLAVAPIVDAGWVPGQRVGAFAVLGSPIYEHGTAEWRQPLNGGIRMNATYAEELGTAAGHFRGDGDFDVAADPVFVRWSGDPEGAAGAGRWRLIQAVLIASLIWSVTTVVGFIMVASR